MPETLRRRRLLFIYGSAFLLFTALFLPLAPLYAGFGITPPYVKNERLTRGSTYDQQITLVRSDPTDDLKVQITMNIPEVESWFTVDRGKEFILPKGSTQESMVVTVRVPDDAQYKKYTGAIRIRTSPVNQEQAGGTVSIALGAQVDVGIEVVDKIEDFTVRKIRLSDLEEGRKQWGLFFPGKIRFFTTIENTGNVPYGPTKVRFEIYDVNGETLLETTTNTNSIKKIQPFAIEEVLAELPTRLPAGQYKAKYAIFKGDEIAQENEVTLSVAAVGAVLGYTGYGFEGLSLQDWAKVAGVILVPLILVIAVILLLRKKKKPRSTLPKRSSPPPPEPLSTPDWRTPTRIPAAKIGRF